MKWLENFMDKHDRVIMKVAFGSLFLAWLIHFGRAVISSISL